MRGIILFLITGLSFSLFSQNKPIYYFDYDGKKISKAVFENSRFQGNIFANHQIYLEADTCFYAVLNPRKLEGKLNKVEFDSLKSYLNTISYEQNTYKNYIVINYNSDYASGFTNNKESTWNIYDSDYLKRLKRIIKCNQFWVYKNEKDIQFYRKKKLNWIYDKYNFITELFFPYQISFGSYVIINPDGYYLCLYGEYSKHDVWEDAKQLKKSFK